MKHPGMEVETIEQLIAKGAMHRAKALCDAVLKAESSPAKRATVLRMLIQASREIGDVDSAIAGIEQLHNMGSISEEDYHRLRAENLQKVFRNPHLPEILSSLRRLAEGNTLDPKLRDVNAYIDALIGAMRFADADDFLLECIGRVAAGEKHARRELMLLRAEIRLRSAQIEEVLRATHTRRPTLYASSRIDEAEEMLRQIEARFGPAAGRSRELAERCSALRQAPPVDTRYHRPELSQGNQLSTPAENGPIAGNSAQLDAPELVGQGKLIESVGTRRSRQPVILKLNRVLHDDHNRLACRRYSSIRKSERIPAQVINTASGHDDPRESRVLVLTDLFPFEQLTLSVEVTSQDNQSESGLSWHAERDDSSIEIRTGRLRAKVFDARGGRSFAGKSVPPPIISVARNGGEWIGRGSMVFADDETSVVVRLEVIEDGPNLVRFRYDYAIGEATYVVDVDAYDGAAHLIVSESCSGVPSAAFQYSFEQSDLPDRAIWQSLSVVPSEYRGSTVDYSNDKVAWHLPNYTMWALPFEAFVHAFYRHDRSDDVVGVFTVDHGYWSDLDFERASNRPASDDPDADWSQRRWWGSTRSAVSVHVSTNPKAYYRMPLHEGTRSFAIFARTLEEIDDPNSSFSRERADWAEVALNRWQAIDSAGNHACLNKPAPAQGRNPMEPERISGLLQHKPSVDRHTIRRRLLDFAARPTPRILLDERSAPLLRRATEGGVGDWILRQAMARAPELEAYITDDQTKAAEAADYLRAAVEPFARELMRGSAGDRVGPPRLRRVAWWCYTYDLLEGRDLFSRGEKERLRDLFITIGTALYSPNYMAWLTTAGHPNFDADRFEAILMCALAVPDHPWSAVLVEHALFEVENAIRMYTVPGSGKWAENPACYYFASMQPLVACAHYLKKLGVRDLYSDQRFQEFLCYPISILTPPHFVDPGAERDGVAAAMRHAPDTTRVLPPHLPPGARGRRIAGVGDHAGTGTSPSVMLLVAATDAEDSAPALSGQLRAWWRSGGQNEIRTETQAPHLAWIACLPDQQQAILDAPPLNLAGGPIRGLGAVSRSHIGTKNEGFVFFKCGPGGYRFQSDEANLIWYALGEPVLLDGGDNVPAAMHSTLEVTEDPTSGRFSGLGRGRLVRASLEDDYSLFEGRFPEVFLYPSLGASAVSEEEFEWTRSFDFVPPPGPEIASRSIVDRNGHYLLVIDRLIPRIAARQAFQYAACETSSDSSMLSHQITSEADAYRVTTPHGVEVAVWCMTSMTSPLSGREETRHLLANDHVPDWSGLPVRRVARRCEPGQSLVTLMIPGREKVQKVSVSWDDDVLTVITDQIADRIHINTLPLSSNDDTSVVSISTSSVQSTICPFR